MHERIHGWESIWQCDRKETRARINHAIKEAIKRANMEGAKGALITSGRRIAETVSGFKKITSIGLDLWAIKEFGQCAPEDLDRLVELLMEWDMEITAPAQWLVNLMAMIPKKKNIEQSTRWQVDTGSTQGWTTKVKDNGMSKTRMRTTHRNETHILKSS